MPPRGLTLGRALTLALGSLALVVALLLVGLEPFVDPVIDLRDVGVHVFEAFELETQEGRSLRSEVSRCRQEVAP